MSTILKATKYQLMSFRRQSLLCFSIIALNLLISITFTYWFPGSGVSAGSSDIVALIWIFVLGLSFFKPSFKFLLANAVSRKSLFWANIISLASVSAAWAAAVTGVIWLVRSLHLQIIVLYVPLYQDPKAISSVVWFFSAFFLLSVSGWFIYMVYYRSNKLMKITVSIAPFVLSGLFTIINQASNGKLLITLEKSLIPAIGFSSDVPNPYISAFSMLLFAVIICTFNFLLIRKAVIKD